MTPDKFRHRVRIQRQSSVQDENGDIVTAWIDWATVWAAVEPLSAREFIQSSAVQSNVSARITIRYRSGVNPSMRILHRDKIYGITGVLADRESGCEYLTLPCTEGVGEGF